MNVEESEGIHTITLNRPERRNALSLPLIRDLIQALEDAERCCCGALLITGAGSAFCSGMDLDDLQAGGGGEESSTGLQAFLLLMRRLYDFSKPTIAAVNGPALAGGSGLAMQCDFTLAADRAKFGYTEVRIGFIPAVVSVFLVSMIGEKRARGLLLSGRIFTSKEALDLGLITEVTSETELISRSRSLAASLLRNSPEAMRSMKQLLNDFSRTRLDAELRQAIEQGQKLRAHPDFHEGIRAFLEKRDPVWPSRRRQ
ncbi:MAG TPA: enoyl-CoA hydratase/isomerase family protein [Acidobacteriaceae bacterium]|nr:enoyl-CoA hydratase/isomerase family protein [Acidobacteriaceae bacterium]